MSEDARYIYRGVIKKMFVSLALLSLFIFAVEIGMNKLTNNSKENVALVIEESKKAHPDKPLLAALTATQAILESALLSKPSQLAMKYNNLFGIKGRGTEGSVSLMTNEYYNGKMNRVKQPFAHNKDISDSFAQHKKLFERSRYAKLHDAKTFEDIAKEVRVAGYATDPSYTKLLIDVYNKHVKGKI